MSSAISAPQRKWSEGDRARVKAMLANGASSSVIAAEMGLNRNQVIGRIHRDAEMKLGAASCGPKTKPRRTSFFEQIRFKAPSKPHRSPIEAPSDTPPTPPLPEHAMPLASTGRQWCKWPIKDAPGMICCGAPVMHYGSPWCPYHHGIATQPREYRHG